MTNFRNSFDRISKVVNWFPKHMNTGVKKSMSLKISTEQKILVLELLLGRFDDILFIPNFRVSIVLFIKATLKITHKLERHNMIECPINSRSRNLQKSSNMERLVYYCKMLSQQKELQRKVSTVMILYVCYGIRNEANAGKT